MDRNEILEKNLLEAGRLLKESKKMITLTYSERTYLQQWFYEKTGNRLSSRKCDLEEALYVFYEDKKPKEIPVDEKLIDEILDNSEVSEKKATTPKKKKIVKNENEEKSSDTEV